jgi:hypothetical protein
MKILIGPGLFIKFIQNQKDFLLLKK